MTKFLVALLSGILAVVTIPFIALGGDKVIKMSTTTSTQVSGLLDGLLPAFAKDTAMEVKVFAKGIGAAIRDGMDGNVDVIFVHAKAREEAFVAEGYGTHTKQRDLWMAAGIALVSKTTTLAKKGKKRHLTFKHPKGLGEWYLSIDQGNASTTRRPMRSSLRL